MKIKGYIITKDMMNYPDTPIYSDEFDINSIDDIISNVENVLKTFKGIYPDSITINAINACSDDDDDCFETTIFEYETEKKNEKLTDVMGNLISHIRNINLKNIFN